MKKKKILSIILSVICWALVAFLALVVVYMLCMRISGKTPKIFGYTCLTVVSPSMEPTIMTGDYILIRDTAPENLSEGDIITFISRDSSIYGEMNTHRIVEVNNDNGSLRFTTKGDNQNNTVDALAVPAEDVVGVYVKTLGFLSIFSGLLSSQYAFLIIVLIPAVIFFFFEMLHVYKVATAKNSNGESKKTAEKSPDDNDKGKDE